ncbi:hypothetical protein KR222_011746 [Zaprionus bogoriensis]|nr:hypothetical protein KR222_011746 [Zaprionus bogoriensis]
MAELLNWCGDAITAAIEYLQTIKIAEVRQTLELVGVQHIEVVAALVLFVMLQFTKFTAVLLIAFLIAYSIFYMLPDLKDNLALPENGYRSSYHTPATPSNASGNNDVGGAGTRSRPDDNFDDNNMSSSRTDARTSALFPPFNTASQFAETLPGDHNNEPETKQLGVTEGYQSSMSTIDRNSPQSQGTPSRRDTHTPVGQRLSSADQRPPQRRGQSSGAYDDPRYSRRDPMAFRRMISNEYRQYRTPPTSDTRPSSNRYATYFGDESRYRRPQGYSNEPKTHKNRKTSAEKRPSNPRSYFAMDHFDRLRSISREHINRLPISAAGPSHRSNPPYGRPMPGATENPKKKGRIERDILMKLRLNRWGLPFF